MQRWQVTFSRGEALLYVGHLDLARAWQRVLRRADIQATYSKGFHPHPKISFCAPLPVGVIGAAELLEVSLEEDLTAEELTTRVRAHLPPGLAVIEVAPLTGPALPSRLRFTAYRVGLTCGLRRDEIELRIESLLSSSELPRARQREKQVRRYDLRPLIARLWLERWDSAQIIGMRLRSDNAGAGRPDEVVDALGLTDARLWIERTQLILDS